MNKIISSLTHAFSDINRASQRLVAIQTDLQDPRRGPHGAGRQF